jgi:hypothetical protein
MSEAATIVSLLPYEPAPEFKPGVYPGYFTLPKAARGDIELLLVETGSAYLNIPERKEAFHLEIHAEDLANSIVKDYVDGQIQVDEDQGPGLFVIPGRHSKESVKREYKEYIDGAEARQRRWFESLIKVADDLWSKYHKHTSIPDLSRFASTYLGVKREWNIRASEEAVIECPACATVIRASIAICPQCKCIIDPVKAKALSFATIPTAK